MSEEQKKNAIVGEGTVDGTETKTEDQKWWQKAIAWGKKHWKGLAAGAGLTAAAVGGLMWLGSRDHEDDEHDDNGIRPATDEENNQYLDEMENTEE